MRIVNRFSEDLFLRVSFGGVAQLGERLLCKQEVIGSIPFTSTIGLMRWRERGFNGIFGEFKWTPGRFYRSLIGL